jgi:uncharacterized protein (UPF0254 family)
MSGTTAANTRVPVSIGGTAGVGKTALACQSGSRLV